MISSKWSRPEGRMRSGAQPARCRRRASARRLASTLQPQPAAVVTTRSSSATRTAGSEVLVDASTAVGRVLAASICYGLAAGDDGRESRQRRADATRRPQRPKSQYKYATRSAIPGPALLASTKLGTIQRRLAWPLRKDDTHNSRRIDTKPPGGPLFGPTSADRRQTSAAPGTHDPLRGAHPGTPT